MASNTKKIEGQDMPSLGFTTSPQEIVVDGISGPGAANRMVIVTGLAQLPGLAGQADFTTWVGPEFEPGQFRRAIATASVTAFGDLAPVAGTTPAPAAMHISAVEAELDDESGRVVLRITASGVAPKGLAGISYQVLIFAAV